MIELRRTTVADAPQVAETVTACFATYPDWAPGWRDEEVDGRAERLADRLASPEVWSLLALDDGEVVGHVSIAERPVLPVLASPPGFAKLWQLFVRPRWQGTGIATELLRAGEREAIERGFSRMSLWTPRDHARARRFYEREGWRASGRTEDENPMRLPVVEYVKTLLPVPEDDGAADHLPGSRLPSVALLASDGSTVDLAGLAGRSVVFAYPRTGKPGEPPLGGTDSWNAIPGARGCTPQACALRDLHAEFATLGVRVFGLSTQPPEEQRELVERLHLPYLVLSDPEAELGLPTFEVEGVVLYRRLTLLLCDGVVEDVVYPVFPPDEAADQALARLRS